MQLLDGHNRNTARRLFWQMVDAVLPPRCVVTGEIVDRQGMVAPEAWAGLDFISAPFCACCGYPFEFDVSEGEDMRCASCLADPPPFASARAALSYGGAVRDIILRFKHGDQLHAADSFVPWLQRSGAQMLGEADMIVPVPLHRWRLLRRRYNQAAILAQKLAKATGRLCIVDGLRRVRATATQGHMGYKDRAQNVKNAFAAHPGYDFSGKTVVLVDDVYTTGATVKACVKALTKAGAAKVHVLALARVVKPDFM